MSFKKQLIFSALLLAGTTSFSQYQVQYPNSPVTFKDIGEWVQLEPHYTDWLDVGKPYDCTSANPLENTQTLGHTYTKNFYGCHQLQERQKNIAEKNTSSNEIRNSISLKETQILSDTSYSVSAVGTKIVKDCKYSTSAPLYGWYDIATTDIYTSTYGMAIDWDGSKKINNMNNSQSFPKNDVFVHSNYTYSRGEFKQKKSYSQGKYYYVYEVCREPIIP